jgi:hypothetical protein
LFLASAVLDPDGVGIARAHREILDTLAGLENVRQAQQYAKCGVLGRRVALNWFSMRRWSGSLVIYKAHSEHRQLGEPLTSVDHDFNTLQRPATGRWS